MTREGAIRHLFFLWMTIAVVSTCLLTAQVLLKKYGDDSTIAWNWLLIQYTPAVGILLSSVFSDPSKRWRQAPSTPWKFRSAKWMSYVQACLIFSILLLEPLLPISSFEIFESTQILLALLQSVVVAAIGAVVFDGR